MTPKNSTSASAQSPSAQGKNASAAKGGRVAVRLEMAGAAPNSEPGAMATSQKPRARSQQKRGDDVRHRVLTAALECFGAFGYEGTSTRAVAERAGVTHTLVIYHFGSKERLWIAMMEDALGNYSTSLAENLGSSADRPASDALKTFIEQFVRLSAAHPQIHRILTMEGNQETDRLKWVIDHYLRQHFIQVRDLIKRGQAEGSVKECDAARLYYYIIGGGGTPYTLSTEYRELTGRDVFSEAEIYRNIAFLLDTVFV